MLRPDHGHKQIDEQEQGHEARDDGFHTRLQSLTEADIDAAHDKEPHDQGDEEQVIHNENRFSRP